VVNLPRKPKIPFSQMFPHANPLACDLLEKLLTFEPEVRITVEEALKHPYLEELHCEDDEVGIACLPLGCPSTRINLVI